MPFRSDRESDEVLLMSVSCRLQVLTKELSFVAFCDRANHRSRSTLLGQGALH